MNQDPDTMQSLGNFLCVEEPLEHSDIIYVLGGDFATRIPRAAELFKLGLAPRIVIPYEYFERPTPGMEHFSNLSIRLLREAGVPDGSIFLWKVQSGVTSTADEMRALALYAQTFAHISRIIVVTSNFHSRRARYTANRMLSAGTTIQVSGVPPSGWNISGWWHDPLGRQMVTTEWKKLLYYYPRYLFG
jgi:uncharacterized SAM-binding protein YcdF (DUF218 family)